METFLDLRTFPCPQPVFKARQQLKKMHTGDVLIVWCKTKAAADDFASFCRVTGHDLLSIVPIHDYYEIKIKNQ